MSAVTIAGIRFAPETVRTLEAAGAATAESVAADLARVRGGDSAGLLAQCLGGAEGSAKIVSWCDYVSTLLANAE